MIQKISNNPNEIAKALYTVIYWEKFFSDDEIDKIIKLCQFVELKKSSISSNNPVIDNSVRTSDINFHSRNEQNYWIFDRFNFGIEDINSKFFHFDLYGYSSFQYSEYNYLNSGKYNFHMDTFTNQESLNSNEFTRKLSLVILLSEPNVDFEGGEFQINEGLEERAKTIKMTKGTLIAFPSFMIHRVKTVTKGIRKSITIWVEGPKFK